MTHSCTFTATATVQLLPRAHWSCVSRRWARWMSTNRLKLNEDKTELLRTGSDHSIRKSSGSLTVPRWLLEPTSSTLLPITFDLRLTKHASIVGGKSFFQQRQLRRALRTLDAVTAATLIHEFVTSRIDYCNCLLADAPKVWTDKLQRILNTVARI